MKDLFSDVSKLYSTSRPGYPDEMIDFIISNIKNRTRAWDVATGNGQIARLLSMHFKEVIATDISQQQLDNAFKKDNINYKKEQAESTSINDHSIDLVIVGQAIHWFEFSKFYNEVNRVLSPGGMIAAIGYGLIEVDRKVDRVIQILYEDILRTYWDPERKYIDDKYTTIPFPFRETSFPPFQNTYNWSFDQLINNINTWSAISHYKKKNAIDPLNHLLPELMEAWGNSKTKEVTFPIFGRIGFID